MTVPIGKDQSEYQTSSVDAVILVDVIQRIERAARSIQHFAERVDESARAVRATTQLALVRRCNKQSIVNRATGCHRFIRLVPDWLGVHEVTR